jgi:hypothetical protein
MLMCCKARRKYTGTLMFGLITTKIVTETTQASRMIQILLRDSFGLVVRSQEMKRDVSLRSTGQMSTSFRIHLLS